MRANTGIICGSCRLSAIVLLAVTLWGCSNEDPMEIPSPETYISFGMPSVSMSGPEISEMGTRAGAELYSGFPENGTFKVLGYLGDDVDKNWATKAVTIKPDVFNEKDVTYSGEVCTYQGLQPWNVNTRSLYTFFAYFPTDGGFSVKSKNDNGSGAPVLTYTMPDDPASDPASVKDAMVAVSYDHEKAKGNVNFTFSHLMTAIRFRVNNFNNPYEYDENGEILEVDGDPLATDPVRIHSITLAGNFYKETTLDYTPVRNDENGYKNHMLRKTQGNYEAIYKFWDADEMNRTLDVSGDDYAFVGDDRDVGTMVLLLPGANTDEATDKVVYSGLGSGVTFTCNYTFLNKTMQSSGTVSLDNISFESGKLYTVNLNFVGNSFTMLITSDDTWQNGSDNDIIIK